MVKTVRFFIMSKLVYILVMLLPLTLFGQERHVFTIKDSTDTAMSDVVTHLNLKAINLDIPENVPKGRYQMVGKFTVHPDNTISDITVEKDPGHGLGESFKKFISSLPEKYPDFILRTDGNRNMLIRIALPLTVSID